MSDNEYAEWGRGHHFPCPCGAELSDECPMNAMCARVNWADRRADIIPHDRGCPCRECEPPPRPKPRFPNPARPREWRY